jgi:hypothetical protein
MSRDTLEWLAWLIQQQTVHLGDPNARAIAAQAFRALDEIGAALAALDKTD